MTEATPSPIQVKPIVITQQVFEESCGPNGGGSGFSSHFETNLEGCAGMNSAETDERKGAKLPDINHHKYKKTAQELIFLQKEFSS